MDKAVMHYRNPPEHIQDFITKIADLYPKDYSGDIKHSKSAMKGCANSWYIDAWGGVIDELTFIDSCRPKVIDFLKSNKNVKVKLPLCCYKMLQKRDGETAIEKKYFHSNSLTNIRSTNVMELLNKLKSVLLKRREEKRRHTARKWLENG